MTKLVHDENFENSPMIQQKAWSRQPRFWVIRTRLPIIGGVLFWAYISPLCWSGTFMNLGHVTLFEPKVLNRFSSLRMYPRTIMESDQNVVLSISIVWLFWSVLQRARASINSSLEIDTVGVLDQLWPSLGQTNRLLRHPSHCVISSLRRGTKNVDLGTFWFI